MRTVIWHKQEDPKRCYSSRSGGIKLNGQKIATRTVLKVLFEDVLEGRSLSIKIPFSLRPLARLVYFIWTISFWIFGHPLSRTVHFKPLGHPFYHMTVHFQSFENNIKKIKDGEYSENSEWICGLVNHKRGNKDKPREFVCFSRCKHWTNTEVSRIF